MPPPAPKSGIQPIIGVEIALAGNGERGQRQAGNGHAGEPDRIVLLVQSEAGYRNLMGLTSRAYLDGEAGAEPAVSLADLAAANEGLICLAGGAGGPLGRLVAEGQDEAAEAMLAALKELFPGRLYIELQRHGLPEEAKSEAGLVDLAYAHDVPLVATNNAHFPDRDYYEAHDALLCIAQGKAVADDDRKRLTPQHYFRPAGEMRGLVRRSAGSLRQHAGHRPALRLYPAAAPADPAGICRAGGRRRSRRAVRRGPCRPRRPPRRAASPPPAATKPPRSPIASALNSSST